MCCLRMLYIFIFLTHVVHIYIPYACCTYLYSFVSLLHLLHCEVDIVKTYPIGNLIRPKIVDIQNGKHFTEQGRSCNTVHYNTT